MYHYCCLRSLCIYSTTLPSPAQCYPTWDEGRRRLLYLKRAPEGPEQEFCKIQQKAR